MAPAADDGAITREVTNIPSLLVTVICFVIWLILAALTLFIGDYEEGRLSFELSPVFDSKAFRSLIDIDDFENPFARSSKYYPTILAVGCFIISTLLGAMNLILVLQLSLVLTYLSLVILGSSIFAMIAGTVLFEWSYFKLILIFFCILYVIAIGSILYKIPNVGTRNIARINEQCAKSLISYPFNILTCFILIIVVGEIKVFGSFALISGEGVLSYETPVLTKDYLILLEYLILGGMIVFAFVFIDLVGFAVSSSFLTQYQALDGEPPTLAKINKNILTVVEHHAGTACHGAFPFTYLSSELYAFGPYYSKRTFASAYAFVVILLPPFVIRGTYALTLIEGKGYLESARKKYEMIEKNPGKELLMMLTSFVSYALGCAGAIWLVFFIFDWIIEDDIEFDPIHAYYIKSYAIVAPILAFNLPLYFGSITITFAELYKEIYGTLPN